MSYVMDPLHRPGHAALRRGRCSLPSQIYLVTCVTQQRIPIFLDHDLARTAIRAIRQQVDASGATLLCWVLMPDHWHGVVELGATVSLSDTMRRVKGFSAFEVNRARRSSSPVWGSGFHDHALRFEEDLIGVARYVIENPVRAGLVGDVGLYPYWDAVWVEDWESLI